EEKLPTYFVLNASRLLSSDEIKHYDLHEKSEVIARNWLPHGPAVIGITPGASCPNNLIEETLIRLFELRGISRYELDAASEESTSVPLNLLTPRLITWIIGEILQSTSSFV